MFCRRALPRSTALAFLVAATMVASVACSGAEGSEGPEGTGGAGDASETTTTIEVEAAACEPPDTAASPVATPVSDSVSDHDVASFDGTAIRAHWFPLSGLGAADAPVVLMGPGWGLSGDTDPDAVGVLGAVNIKSLHDAGYHVLTWDPRGVGASGGVAQVNDPDAEGRDVQALIDFVAAQPGVDLDGPRDPRMGMVGGSYGGGIQLVTAALDCRVDAIVPIIAWHSLGTSLYKDETFKAGWAQVLTRVSARVDPHIPQANTAGLEAGVIPDEDIEWFESKGPADLLDEIDVPTLIVQGTVDTLFTLDEAITNYERLRARDVPVAMLWFCGGHGLCLTDDGNPERVAERAIAWLDRYVKGDESVEVGPRFETVDQDGVTYHGDDFPTGADREVAATGRGTLPLVAEGGAGPAEPPPGFNLLSGIAAPITPGPATNAVEVEVVFDGETAGDTPSLVLGAPVLTIRYSGTVADGVRPTRVFAQLVDDASGLVLGNQSTPVPVTLDGEEHTAEVPLEVVAHTASAGSKVRLQLVATTVTYGEPRLGGEVRFEEITIRLPVVDSLRRTP